MKLGSLDISKVYLGSTEVSKAYLGNVVVHEGKTLETPYIKDGLTFLLDGVNKGGDSTAWTDLVKGIKFPYVTGVTADTDNVTFASGHSAMVADKGLTYNSKINATVEIVWQYSHANNQQSIFRSDIDGLGFFQYYRADFGFYCRKSTSSNDVQCIANPTSNRVEGKKLSVTYSPSVGYINGVLANNDGTRNIGIGTLTLGINYVGKIYCIRLYNRVLTEAERLANYAVDVDRFSIT